MRVIAGVARGHNLVAPEGLSTRPTTDRIKETLFNIIAFDLNGCRFLDLFSGSGAIGIEALSRGADKAVFVDSSPVCGKIIEENLKHTKLYPKGRIITGDVLSAVYRLKADNEKFDIIFMDPPYAEGLVEPTLEAIVKSGIADKDCKIIVERGSNTEPPMAEGLKIYREKEYRTTVISFLTLEE